MYQQSSLPFFTRLSNRLTKTWRSRDCLDFEWAFLYDPDTQELEIKFFIERVPTAINLWIGAKEAVYVDRLSYLVDEESEPMEFGAESFLGERELRLRITPAQRLPTTKVLLHFRDPIPEVDSRVKVKIEATYQEDLVAVNNAHDYARAGKISSAIDELNQFEEQWKTNPTTSYWLSLWYQQRGDLDAAEQCAVRAARQGNIEACGERYREVQRDRYPRTVKQIRELHDQARQWLIGDHQGLLVVEKSQQFTLGLNNQHLKKCRNLIEIRRPAAARMLSAIDFPFSTASEYVLFTRMRIIHKDDTEEELSIEHFTVGDHESKNIFITVEDEKVGNWILPDLVAGDLIDWCYHLLVRDRGINGKPHTFFLTGLFDGWIPTFKGRVEISAPVELPSRCAVRNSDCEVSRRVANGVETMVFEDKKFVPARRTGFVFENHYLNPMVICASDDIAWRDVVPTIRAQIYGTSPVEEELPEPLATLVDGIENKESALEHAFYWVRDTLKYATIRSGVRNIGREDRARRIIESGVGNCNDKSYLLALVCKSLGLPHELVSISTKNGILIEDMPADQFDHVFVRVKPNDHWVYLDAASQESTYGSAPAWCQGMQVLVIENEGYVTTIPIDPPDVNSMEVSEVFDRVHAGRVHGSFDFRAHGQCAQFVDERWKRISLNMDDQQQAGQEALREYLPSSAVQTYSQAADTSSRSEFQVSGLHSRGPLVALGKSDKVIVTLVWDVPFLPMTYWRTLQLNRLFVVIFSTTVTLEARLEGDLYRCVEDVSRVRTLDNPVCKIEDDVLDDGSALSVRRTIVFKQKYTRGEEVILVPEALERIEEALQLVISIDAATMHTR